ncbi:MAG: (2Fe-2S)-binding protein [Hyphomicrobiaceae bacterium]
MLARVNDRPSRPVAVSIDGRPFTARAGDSVAVALLEAGHAACRVSGVSESPRGPYCLMGVCFECLVTIDGVANRQGCLIEVRDGMSIETQRTRREAGR